MAIPEGYRLLRSSDVGKTFGVELEPLVYFDDSVSPNNVSKRVSLTNFIDTVIDFGNLTGIRFNNIIIYDSWDHSGWLGYTNYQFESNVEITSYNTDYEWNNWLYVKDIATDPYIVTISNKNGITLLVEGKYLTKDITILLDKSLFGESDEESGGTNTWSVEAVSGASYGFALNSAGYYESQNKAKKSTSAVCKVVLDIKSDCKMYVDCINYAESNYDYGLLSELDTTLGTSASADSTNVFKSFKGLQSPNVVSVDYGTISAGSHFIYVKFRKDSSVDKNNDTLQFTIRLE